MIHTKEYLDEQEDCIRRNFAGYKVRSRRGKLDVTSELRLASLKYFCFGAKTILSVGSGGFEPVYIQATHALDYHKVSGELLASQNWPGTFVIGSCDELPFPDKSFDAAVCSEVIEHLPDLETVKKTFLELDRVSKKWIVSTPNIFLDEPTHKRVFTEQDLIELTYGLNAKVFKRGPFFYVYKSAEGFLE